MNEQKVMAKTAYLALDEKKGEDICVIDISSISVMADYFVLAGKDGKSRIFIKKIGR